MAVSASKKPADFDELLMDVAEKFEAVDNKPVVVGWLVGAFSAIVIGESRGLLHALRCARTTLVPLGSSPFAHTCAHSHCTPPPPTLTNTPTNSTPTATTTTPTPTAPPLPAAEWFIHLPLFNVLLGFPIQFVGLVSTGALALRYYVDKEGDLMDDVEELVGKVAKKLPGL